MKKPRPNYGIKSAYARLYALGVERVRVIDSMLGDGESPDVVASHIQNIWKELTDVSEEALSKQLERYRKKVLLVRKVAAVVRAEEKGVTVFQAARELNTQLDVLAELTKVARMQISRLEKAFELEKDKTLLLDLVTRELRPTLDVLRAVGAIQLETGIIRRAPRTVTGIMTPVLDETGAAGVSFEMQVQSHGELRSAILDAVKIIQGDTGEVLNGNSSG